MKNDVPQDWGDKDFAQNLDPVMREAVAWFGITHGDTVSAADQAAFRAWMRRDPAHPTAYAEVEQLWAGAAGLPAVTERKRKTRRVLTRRMFTQAGMLLAIGGGAWMFKETHPFADYRTATGERRNFALPDGSSADLSTATALSIDFGPDRRNVFLEAGEAFFAVAQDARRPFAVQARNGTTTALGTAFSVSIVDGSVRVTVAEHAVEVATATQVARVEEGSQVTYDSNALSAPVSTDAEAELAWRGGQLVFASARFDRVVAALNRWRSGRIIIMDDALTGRIVTVIVDLNRTDDIMAQLSDALPIRVVHVTPLVTLVFSA